MRIARTHGRVTSALGLALLLWGAGCAKPPTQAMKDAEAALAAAQARSDCAREKYDAAARLLAEARALVKQEKYDEAERKARAAQNLAKQARTEADASWEECQKRNKVVAEAKKTPDAKPPVTDDGPKAALATVYFAYDSAELSADQRQTLDQNALWLRQNAASGLVLEGHTDDRGSSEYNLALGERRANTARQYLIQLGISATRLNILSYGEEKPAAYGVSDEDRRKNRRVEFLPKQGAKQ